MPHFKSIWLWSLASFVLAGLTGLLFRFTVIFELPVNLHRDDIRHAHSHLMLFNWVTPVPMLLIGRHLSTENTQQQLEYCLYAIVGLGLASYLPFLLYGYESVPVGSADLPLSVMLSGFIMFAWYWFATIYVRESFRIENATSRTFFDAALGLLVAPCLRPPRAQDRRSTYSICPPD